MKITKIVEYVKKSFDLISKDYPNTNEQILKSALVYQCLYRYYFKINLPLNQIIRIENSMGLIGADDSLLTTFLQNTIGWSNYLKHTPYYMMHLEDFISVMVRVEVIYTIVNLYCHLTEIKEIVIRVE